jgi:hypothetical protein
MTEAKVKPWISVKISSTVGNGYSFCSSTLLSWKKSMMSQMEPFFFGTPKYGDAHSRVSISSAVSLQSLQCCIVDILLLGRPDDSLVVLGMAWPKQVWLLS